MTSSLTTSRHNTIIHQLLQGMKSIVNHLRRRNDGHRDQRLSASARQSLWQIISHYLSVMSVISSLIMVIFLLGHLSNLSLGIFSIELMDQALPYMMWLWQSNVGLALLGGATISYLLIMLIRMFQSVFQGQILKMKFWQLVHLFTGLAFPFLLIGHVISTRGMHEIADVVPSYAVMVSWYWVLEPEVGVQRVIGLVALWIHLGIGLYYWLRVSPFFGYLKPLLNPFIVLVPALALAGFISAGKDVEERVSHDSAWIDRAFQEARYTPEYLSEIADLTTKAQLGFMLTLLGSVGIYLGYILWSRRQRSLPRIGYKDTQFFDILPGMTLLEAIRHANIPHASVCGGNGRCSTCRVRVSEGLKMLASPSVTELKVLQRINAPSCVRLACQIYPTSDMKVVPLLPAVVTARDGLKASNYLHGEEREIAILFADLRGFTRLSDTRLPYDIVFILNQYFTEMGLAIKDSGGYLDKFIGDGVMALFGIETGPEDGSHQAMIAAHAMLRRLVSLNYALAQDLSEPLRIGIGIHVGPVIVGEMGYGTAKTLTAIGDAVNLASRLEGLTKEYKVDLVISEAVALRCGIDLSHCPRTETPIRGKSKTMTVLPILAKELPAAA